MSVDGDPPPSSLSSRTGFLHRRRAREEMETRQETTQGPEIPVSKEPAVRIPSNFICSSLTCPMLRSATGSSRCIRKRPWAYRGASPAVACPQYDHIYPEVPADANCAPGPLCRSSSIGIRPGTRQEAYREGSLRN